MNKEQRLSVGVNVERKQSYKLQLKSKQDNGQKLLEYAQKFIIVDNKTAFFNSPESYFEAEFENQYKTHFPPMVSQAKRLDLVEFDVVKFKKIAVAFGAVKIEVNGDLEPINEEPDFNTYITGDKAIKEYKSRLALIKAIEKYRATGGDVQNGWVQKAFPWAFMMDWGTNEFKPAQ